MKLSQVLPPQLEVLTSKSALVMGYDKLANLVFDKWNTGIAVDHGDGAPYHAYAIIPPAILEDSGSDDIAHPGLGLRDKERGPLVRQL
jgi:hypothetical protein